MKTIKELIINDGISYYESLLKDINEAKKNIDIESYIIDNDHISQRIIQALINAQKRNVSVRLLLDGFGSAHLSNKTIVLIENNHIQLKIYHPFPWKWWDWKRSTVKKPWLSKWIYLIMNINKRNHRKSCLIDKTIAYFGSFNLSASHTPFKKKGGNWYDIAIRTEHIDTRNLSNAFNACWENRRIRERIKDTFKHLKKAPIIRVNYSWNRRRLLYRDLLKRIDRCNSRIYITTAYFLPSTLLLFHLKKAAKRGVDIQIILTEKSDVFIHPWVAELFFNKLLRWKIKIYRYQPRILHAKTMIIDNWMIIGSSNLNYRSLLHDLEIDYTLQTSAAKTKLVKIFNDDTLESKKITFKNWKKRPAYQRILGYIALYWRYIL